MTRSLVAEAFRWDEYPGLRAGKLYAGKGDIGRHPLGATHAVTGPDAVQTVCGLPRASFPHEFAEPVRLSDCEPCGACRVGTSA